MRQGGNTMDNNTNNIVDSKQVLLQTLTIAGYQGDKEAYADKFLKLCQEDIIYSLLESLPEEKEQALKKELKEKKSFEDVQEILNKNFTSDKIFEVSESVARDSFAKVLEKIK